MKPDMRCLLLSDTHGELGAINELAAAESADCVIHGGDFGFYDDASMKRLSRREIRLRIKHSNLPRCDIRRILALGPKAEADAVESLGLLGGFQRYLAGVESFDVPVYAVWGNHEDRHVVERLVLGDCVVRNLHVLHPRQAHPVASALVYGLGGNFLPGRKMLQRPIAGGGGKIWSTLSEFSDLVRTADRTDKTGGPRIFVSHVSPGVEPFVEFIGASTRADFTVSGHMGVPACKIWDASVLGPLEQAEGRMRQGLDAVREAVEETRGRRAERVRQDLDQLEAMTQWSQPSTVGEPRWYRGMTHVNLPDAHVGYAVMDIGRGGAKVHSRVLSASVH